MDTPLVKRAYNLGLKAVPNFLTLSEEQIVYYEKNLDKIQEAIARGFVISQEKEISDAPLDFTIHVDRSIKPAYPNWVKRVMHPEMELAGPADYNLETEVEQRLHHDQKTGAVSGNTIYDQIKKDDALENCLGLADLLAIQVKGIAVFRKIYAGKAVFGWKSVVQSQGGYLNAPFLVERGVRVVLDWDWLGSYWGSDRPTLRFRK